MKDEDDDDDEKNAPYKAVWDKLFGFDVNISVMNCVHLLTNDCSLMSEIGQNLLQG